MTEIFATGIRMGIPAGTTAGSDVRLAGRRVPTRDGAREVVARVEGLLSIDWLPTANQATTPNGVVGRSSTRSHRAAVQRIVVDAVGRVWVNMPGARGGAEAQVFAVVSPGAAGVSPTTCGSRTEWWSSETTHSSSPSRTPTG
jgi:hypothetical protein